jgi:predicted MFS family arabinose efflux permease
LDSAVITSPVSSVAGLGVSERRMLLLISAVQFVNILDFMIVMPLGPDFARELHIPLSNMGFIGGSYTAAAALAGILAARFLDRFDRRSALAVVMLGLVAGTACAGFARGLAGLMAARVLAGAFGGPATSISLSIIADVVPAQRRGRAMGIVMSAFTLATVAGVPAALELARLGGWRTPFFGVAALGLVVAASAIFAMPRLRLHLATPGEALHPAALRDFLAQPAVLLSLLATVSVMMAAYAIVPNISAYVQGNRGYPRDELGTLFFAGGSVSFVAMRVMGGYIDRLGATAMSALGTVLFASVLGSAFVYEWELPVTLIYVGFMTSMAFRNITLTTLTTRVPLPHERARFLSLQSAAQHLAAAAGAMISAQLLRERPNHSLAGMPRVATLSIALSVFLPGLLWLVEKQLQARETRRAAPPAQRAA